LESTSLIEAECYDDMLGVDTELSTEGTDNVGAINNGDWIKFEDVDADKGVKIFTARVASNVSGGSIELRTDSPTGTLKGTLIVANTGGWQNWETVTTTISEITGVQDLYLVFTGETGSLFNLNWVQFTAELPSLILDASTSNKEVSLNWTLENVVPVTQNIYRNTSFSDSGKTLIAENVNGENYVDSSVTNGETYWYWIEITDSSSILTKSNVIEVTPSIPNLALATNGSIAEQSVTAYGGLPERAIDGNTDGDFNNGSVSHTENGVHDSGTLKWWQVDLQADYNIETVTIFNRTGSNYGERLNNFTVEIKDANDNITFTQLYTAYPNPTLKIEIGGVVGRVVRISKTSDNGITLAEVQVFGVDSSLSIDKTNKIKEIGIYPNPIEDIFMVTNSHGAVIEIFNSVGALMLKNEIKSSSETMDIGSFNSGLYFIRIINNELVVSKKIIKK
jgi:hypothetical protein